MVVDVFVLFVGAGVFIVIGFDLCVWVIQIFGFRKRNIPIVNIKWCDGFFHDGYIQILLKVAARLALKLMKKQMIAAKAGEPIPAADYACSSTMWAEHGNRDEAKKKKPVSSLVQHWNKSN